MTTLAVSAILLVTVCSCLAERNYQEWSSQTLLGVNHTFTCTDNYNLGNDTIEVTAGYHVQWRRHEHEGYIVDSDHFQLTEMHGIDKFELTLMSITEGMSGLYFCEVMFPNMTYRGTIIKGLNLGGHLYEKNIDKYDHNIVVGIIAGGSVFVLVVGIGLIEHFRYRTEEQKQKLLDRKAERKAKLNRWQTSGQVNTGADLDMTEDVKKPIDTPANGEAGEVNTHL